MLVVKTRDVIPRNCRSHECVSMFARWFTRRLLQQESETTYSFFPVEPNAQAYLYVHCVRKSNYILSGGDNKSCQNFYERDKRKLN
jgi:hypothetical protein